MMGEITQTQKQTQTRWRIRMETSSQLRVRFSDPEQDTNRVRNQSQHHKFRPLLHESSSVNPVKTVHSASHGLIEFPGSDSILTVTASSSAVCGPTLVPSRGHVQRCRLSTITTPRTESEASR